MPPLSGAVTGVEPKRGAIVLPATRMAILCWWHIGRKGPRGLPDADTTFSVLHRAGHQDAHRRFWRQLVTWRRLEEEPKAELKLQLGRQELSVGDPLKVSVRLTDPGAAIRDAQLTILVIRRRHGRAALPHVLPTGRRLCGGVHPIPAGDYLVSARAERDGEVLGEDRRTSTPAGPTWSWKTLWPT